MAHARHEERGPRKRRTGMRREFRGRWAALTRRLHWDALRKPPGVHWSPDLGFRRETWVTGVEVGERFN